VFLLINAGSQPVDLVGALMMLGSAVLYALHLLINQRILFEVPAPTVTLYTLLAMGLTVVIAFLIVKPTLPPVNTAWWPVIAMAIITFSSRLTLFMGIKHLGGLQTALLGLSELFVTVLLAQWLLNETFTPAQWFGTLLLMMSLFLIGFDKITPQKRSPTGWLSWLNPPQISANDLPGRSHP
jgi:drug/metabolite transporter (DMT)-like permease